MRFDIFTMALGVSAMMLGAVANPVEVRDAVAEPIQARDVDVMEARDLDSVLETRGKISIPCTVKCAQWHWCRVKGFFLKDCGSEPKGCECDRFAWED